MPDIERKNHCGNCYFFQANEPGSDVGTCRKRSPQMIMHAMENEQHVFVPDWPPVSAHPTHWCGDWEPEEVGVLRDASNELKVQALRVSIQKARNAVNGE